MILAFLLIADIQNTTQAAEALDAGRAAEARAALERTVTRTPGSLDAWALLARAYWTLGDAAKAAAAAKRADLPTASPEAMHALALYHAQSGDRKRAATLEGKYALSAKSDAYAPARAALLHFETGDLASAVRFGELADKRGPRYEVALMLARAYEARKETDAALKRYDQALAMQPDSEEAHSQAGQAYLRAGRFSNAAALLENAATKFPNSAQVQLALGVAYYGQRRFQDAGLRFVRTIDIDATIEQPYVFLAKMIDQLEALWPVVEPQFVKWNERERSAMPPFVLARLYAARGAEDERVEALLRESIARDGKFWESRFELGGALEKRRRWEEAAREYESAAALSARQADVYYRLSRVYARLQKPEKAAEARAKHAALSAGTPASGMAERK